MRLKAQYFEAQRTVAPGDAGHRTRKNQAATCRELRPCPSPWCGRSERARPSTLLRNVHAVVCGECGLVGPACDTLDEAVAAWNTRPVDALLRETRDWLRRDADMRTAIEDSQGWKARERRALDQQGRDSPEAPGNDICCAGLETLLAGGRPDDLIHRLDRVLATATMP